MTCTLAWGRQKLTLSGQMARMFAKVSRRFDWPARMPNTAHQVSNLLAMESRSRSRRPR